MTARALQIGLAVALGLATAGCTSSPRDAPASPAPEVASGAPAGAPASSTPDAPADTVFASEADYAAQRDAAVGELEAAVSTRAGSADACLALTYGEQACGGPTDWIVLSTETSDADRVRQLAARVTALDARANAQFEFMSTCALLEAPPVELRAGVCQAAP